MVAAVIPAFNEEKRIWKVIRDAAKYVDKIIVVDDGSCDKTAQQVKNRKAIVLTHRFNLGQGAALQTGFDYAKKINADIVITFDADGQFKASEIPRVIKPILEGRIDAVLGSRFLGGTVDMPLSRRMTLRLGIIFTNIFYGIKLTDTFNGFRAFSSGAIHKINLTQNRMAHAAEIIDQIQLHKLKFVEVPVTVIYNKNTFNKGLRNINAFKLFFDLITKKLS
ncbi:glycosyltransferase family 2 protein [Candidatus Microgenomates bacterium]|nr:glycosyltransferase family 2 protein [Candidatus Microgenomates bacterium]